VNAQEAAALATKVVTTEHKAMTEIWREAERRQRYVMLSRRRPNWFKAYLEGEGFTATVMHSGDQRDPTALRVSW